SIVDILHLIDWPAVHTHTQPKLRMILQCPRYFHSTLHRFLWSFKEDQRHPITDRNTNQPSGGFAFAELRSLTHDAGEVIDNFTLLVDQQLRVTDHVDE